MAQSHRVMYDGVPLTIWEEPWMQFLLAHLHDQLSHPLAPYVSAAALSLCALVAAVYLRHLSRVDISAHTRTVRLPLPAWAPVLDKVDGLPLTGDGVTAWLHLHPHQLSKTLSGVLAHFIPYILTTLSSFFALATLAASKAGPALKLAFDTASASARPHVPPTEVIFEALLGSDGRVGGPPQPQRPKLRKKKKLGYDDVPPTPIPPSNPLALTPATESGAPSARRRRRPRDPRQSSPSSGTGRTSGPPDRDRPRSIGGGDPTSSSGGMMGGSDDWRHADADATHNAQDAEADAIDGAEAEARHSIPPTSAFPPIPHSSRSSSPPPPYTPPDPLFSHASFSSHDEPNVTSYPTPVTDPADLRHARWLDLLRAGCPSLRRYHPSWSWGGDGGLESMNGGGGDAGTDIHLPSAGLDVGYFDQVGPGMGGHGGVGYPNPAERDLLATPDGATLALDWHLYQPSPLPRSQPASDSGPTAGLAAPLTPPTRDSHQHDPSVVYLVCYSYGRGDPTLNASHPVVSLLEHIPITPATSVAILHPRGLPSQVPPTSPTLSSPHYPCDVALAAGLVRRKAKEAAVVLVGLGREGVGMAARYVSERGGDGRMVEVFVGVGWQAGDWPAAGHSKEVHTWVRDVRDIVARYPALFYSSPLDLDPDAVLRPGATARDVETALIAPAYGFSTVAEYREAQGWAVVAGVGVPTLLLLSSTDPFAPPLGYPLTDLAENPNVVVATSQLGGHLGWREGWFAQNTTGVYGAGKSIKAGKRWWCKVVREVGGLAELLSYVTPILRPPRADQPLPALLPSPGLPRTLLGSSPSANHLARYIPSVWFNLIPACESHGLRGASTTDATWVLRALSLPAAVEDLEGETRRAEGAWDIDDYGADEALQPLASSQFSIASGVSTGSVIPSGRELRRLTSVSSSLGQLRRVVPGIPLAQPVSQQPGPSRRASSRSVSSMVSGGSESHLVLQTAEVWRREAGSGVTEIVTTPGGAPSPLVLPTAVATTPLSEGDGSSRNRVLMDVRPVLNFARRDSETQEELPDVSWFSDSSTPLALDLAGATNVPSPPFRRPLDRRSRSADRAMSVRTASRRSTVVPEVEAEAAAAWSAPEKHLPSETTQSMGEGSTPPATPTQTRSAKSWITNRPSSVLSMVPLSPDSRRSSLSLSRTSPCTATPRNRIFWWILVARRIVALSFIAALHQMTIWTGKGGAMERSARRLRESAVTRVREIPRYPSDALTMSAVANARSQDRTAFLRAVAVVVASGLTWVFGLQASRMMKDRADTLLAYEILHLLETAASMAVTQV